MIAEKKPNADEPSNSAGAAYAVLIKMAPECIPPLIDALTNQDIQIWGMAAGILGEIGPEAKAAIPRLSLRLPDKDPRIRLGAAVVIGKLDGDPATFVPVMIALLHPLAHEAGDFEFLLDALLHYPEQAKPAVPILVDILNSATNSTDPDNTLLRDDVTRALQKINDATSAEVK